MGGCCALESKHRLNDEAINIEVVINQCLSTLGYGNKDLLTLV
jgi:hypothetical protein